MKLKDIKVGDLVAIGAPNSTYGSPACGRITKVGVHGRVRGTWHGYSSTRKNYVEFKLVEIDDNKVRRAFSYSCRVEIESGEFPMRSFSGGEPKKTREVHRAPSNHVLRSWDDQLDVEKAAQRRDDAARVQSQRENAEREEIVQTLKKHGIAARVWGGQIALSFPDARKLADLVAKHFPAEED